MKVYAGMNRFSVIYYDGYDSEGEPSEVRKDFDCEYEVMNSAVFEYLESLPADKSARAHVVDRQSQSDYGKDGFTYGYYDGKKDGEIEVIPALKYMENYREAIELEELEAWRSQQEYIANIIKEQQIPVTASVDDIVYAMWIDHHGDPDIRPQAMEHIVPRQHIEEFLSNWKQIVPAHYAWPTFTPVEA